MDFNTTLEQFRKSTLDKMPNSVINNFEEALKEMRDSKLTTTALQVGDKMPNFILPSVDGRKLSLSDVHTSDYLILNFYRGGWCPYCNLELREYQRLSGQFNSLATNIIAISAELPHLGKQTHVKNSISFPILTDQDGLYMKQIGLMFSLNEKMKKVYEGFGLDLSLMHGNQAFEMPIPALYLIDKNNIVLYTYLEEDHSKRIDPSYILTILNNKTA